MKTFHGIIRGTTIELVELPDIADGTPVRVVVQKAGSKQTSGTGLLRSAGALANSWTDDDDRILALLADDRLNSVGRELPE